MFVVLLFLLVPAIPTKRGKVRPADKLQLKAAKSYPLLDSPDPSKTQSTVGPVHLCITYYIYHFPAYCYYELLNKFKGSEEPTMKQS